MGIEDVFKIAAGANLVGNLVAGANRNDPLGGLSDGLLGASSTLLTGGVWSEIGDAFGGDTYYNNCIVNNNDWNWGGRGFSPRANRLNRMFRRSDDIWGDRLWGLNNDFYSMNQCYPLYERALWNDGFVSGYNTAVDQFVYEQYGYKPGDIPDWLMFS